MAAFSDQESAVQRIKDAAQIVEVIGECVALKRSGVNFKGLCPFHGEKTPSFMVNPERQTFHCFGCGEGGDVFAFVMLYHRMTFPEALKSLADRYHIILPERQNSGADRAQAQKREALFAANERAANLYHDFLLKDKEAAPARAYLAERGMPEEIIEKFRLGYAPDSWDFLTAKIGRTDFPPALAEEAGLVVRKQQSGYYDRFRKRVLFPIFNLTGRVMGFGGRILGDGQPKYLNSPETLIFDKGRTLFGLYQHRDRIRKKGRAVIVEGNFDLLALAAQGLDYVVAPLGTALTRNQIRLLKGYGDGVILLFDGDSAGLKAAMRAVPLFLAEQVSARISVLPAEHDPDTFIRAHGRDGLEEHLEQAAPLMEFVFDRLVEKYGLAMAGKAKILEELRPLLEATAETPLQRSVLISHFSERLKLDPDQVLKGFQAAGRQSNKPLAPPRPTQQAGPGAQAPASDISSLSRGQRQLLEFLILYPGQLPRFLEAGLEEIITEPAALKIIGQLKEILAHHAQAGPELLLDRLKAGPERSFVSKLLIEAPSLLDEDDLEVGLEKMVEEQLFGLKAEGLKQQKKQLDHEIEAARRAGDEALSLELNCKRAAINQAFQKELAKNAYC